MRWYIRCCRRCRGNRVRHVWPLLFFVGMSGFMMCVFESCILTSPRSHSTKIGDPKISNNKEGANHHLYKLHAHRHFSCPEVCVLRTLRTSSFEHALEACTQTKGCVVVSRKWLNSAHRTPGNGTGKTILCACVERDAGDMVPAWGGCVPFGFLNYAWESAVRIGCTSFGPTLSRLISLSGEENKCMRLKEQQLRIHRNSTISDDPLVSLQDTFSAQDGKKAICKDLALGTMFRTTSIEEALRLCQAVSHCTTVTAHKRTGRVQLCQGRASDEDRSAWRTWHKRGCEHYERGEARSDLVRYASPTCNRSHPRLPLPSRNLCAGRAWCPAFPWFLVRGTDRIDARRQLGLPYLALFA
eukprot:m.1245104 g.1245104  ORF g.1245104 m.1245104 type:complete len:356 (-) comp24684_c0_seq76:4697-5764(-)